MKKNENSPLLPLTAAVFLALFLIFFYLKYVPQIPSFQLILLPLLLGTFFMTLFNIQYGILFFALAYPLTNSIPYFFGIYESTPHAPTALLLFLFFFLGWLAHHSLTPKKIDFRRPAFKPLFKPLSFTAAFLLISALITALRFANFFPFLSRSIYELKTNVTGVTSGGALMSTLFHSLNYLTGFALLFVLVHSIRTTQLVKKLFTVLMASLIFSSLMGVYQYFVSLSFGNTPFWVRLGQLNATFKDSNSFATFLVMVIPLLLSLVFVFKGWLKVLPLFTLALSFFIYPHIGNRSSLLGLLAGVILFFILLFKKKKPFKKITLKRLKVPVILALILCLLAALVFGYFSFKDSRLMERTRMVKDLLSPKGSLYLLSPARHFIWKEALRTASLYPVTGVGIGAFIIELPNYYSIHGVEYIDEEGNYRFIDSAENYFLHILAELGLIGLIFFGWLFVVLFSLGIKAYKKFDFKEKSGYLMIGAMAGAAVYIPNLFFHSYIGNFGVKYTFWILAAVVFSLARGEIKPKEKKTKKSFLVLIWGLIFVFAAVHLWNSTHSLSLEHRTEKFGLQQNFGLHALEKTPTGREFQWTRKTAGKTLTVKKPVLSIPLHASHPNIREKPVKVKIFLIQDFFREKRLLDEISLHHTDWQTYDYEVPAETGEEVLLLFKVSRTWNPWKQTRAPDTRNLGIALGPIHFNNPPKKQ